MNKTAAFILTLFIDFCVLLAGSALIVLLNVGGIIIMLIEFYCIKSIHNAVYGWLIGLGTHPSNQDTTQVSQSSLLVEDKKKEKEDGIEDVVVNDKVTASDQTPDMSADNVPEKTETSNKQNGDVAVVDLFEEKHKTQISEEEATNLPYELDIDDLIHNREEECSNGNEDNKTGDEHGDDGDNSKKILIGMLVVAIVIVGIIMGLKTCSTENTGPSLPPPPQDSTEIDFNSEVTKPASYENEIERWDAESCVYANFKNGVAFRLPNDIPWHKVSGVAKHTVVKFIQPNTEITLFVNLQEMTEWPDATLGDDIWEFYNVFTERVVPEALKMASENSSEKILDYTFRKSEICGKHAIKTVYKSKLVDSRLEENIMLVTIEYTFLYRKSQYTVALKCYEDVKNALAEDGVEIEDFLQSFMLTPIDVTS